MLLDGGTTGTDIPIEKLVMEQTERCRLLCFSSNGNPLLYAVFCDENPVLQTANYIEALTRYREKVKETESGTCVL